MSRLPGSNVPPGRTRVFEIQYPAMNRWAILNVPSRRKRPPNAERLEQNRHRGGNSPGVDFHPPSSEPFLTQPSGVTRRRACRTCGTRGNWFRPGPSPSLSSGRRRNRRDRSWPASGCRASGNVPKRPKQVVRHEDLGSPTRHFRPRLLGPPVAVVALRVFRAPS